MRRIGCCLALALLALALLSPGTWAQQQAQIPRQHRALHDALQARVAAFRAALPRVRGDPPLLRGAPVRALSCTTPGELLSPMRRIGAQREMDALRRAGVQLVVIEACHPLLTPAFHDPRPVLELLANVANDARMRGLRLLLRHVSLAPAQAVVQGRHHYRGITRARFFEERLQEAKLLVIAVQPDYLTLASSPRVQAGLSLRPSDWRAYLDSASTRLRADLGDLVPALGAGSSLEESPTYVDAFADVAGLDYVDLRFYRATRDQDALLERLISWPRAIRARDPAKRLVLSELWLAKAAGDEAAAGPYEGATAARASYGFWSGLDAAFLRAVAHAARTGGIDVLAVSRPDLLFSYLDFFDPTLFRATPRYVLELAAQRAAAASDSGALSETGRAFGAL
ncbi:MAG: hypothetical protein IT532_09910 [Burkholderiales bacterium]|nr:hypothetical protein [Burkholderiales bacterium]